MRPGVRATTLVSQTTSTYDAVGRVTRLLTANSGGTLADYQYGYVALGRLVSADIDGSLRTYTHDYASQLTSEQSGTGTSTYSYDLAGNRTMSGYSVGADNRILSDGTWKYTYDDEGNRVSKESISGTEKWTYAYDHANRLIRAERASNGTDVDYRVESAYDAWGNRVSKSVDADADGALNPVVTKLAFDGWNPASAGASSSFAIWAAMEVDGTLETRYLPGDGPDEQLGRIDAASSDPTPRWTLVDRQGSGLAIVGAAGSVVGEIRYDAYGRVTSETAPTVSGTLGWAGSFRDVELGLLLFGGHHYQPSTGSWMARSPNGGFAVSLASNNSPTARGPTNGSSDDKRETGPRPGTTAYWNDIRGGYANPVPPPVPRPQPAPPRPRYDPNQTPLLAERERLESQRAAAEAEQQRLAAERARLRAQALAGNPSLGTHAAGATTVAPANEKQEGQLQTIIDAANAAILDIQKWLIENMGNPNYWQLGHTDVTLSTQETFASLVTTLIEAGIEVAAMYFAGPLLCGMAASEWTILRLAADMIKGWMAGEAIANTANDIVDGNFSGVVQNLTIAWLLGQFCFAAGTPISTEHGLMPIESVTAGMRVWAFDHGDGRWKLRPVVETYANDFRGNIVRVSVAGEHIESTPFHPYWVVDGEYLAARPVPDHTGLAPEGTTVRGRWVDAVYLRPGDVLLLRGGRTAPVVDISHRFADTKVYNFHVEELETYAVGANAALVHNTLPCRLQAPGALRSAAVELHSLAHPYRVRGQTVAIAEVRMPDGTRRFVGSANTSAGLTRGQIDRMRELGIEIAPMRGTRHAEMNIIESLPPGARVERWGISSGIYQTRLPCGDCEGPVGGIGGAIE